VVVPPLKKISEDVRARNGDIRAKSSKKASQVRRITPPPFVHAEAVTRHNTSIASPVVAVAYYSSMVTLTEWLTVFELPLVAASSINRARRQRCHDALIIHAFRPRVIRTHVKSKTNGLLSYNERSLRGVSELVWSWRECRSTTDYDEALEILDNASRQFDICNIRCTRTPRESSRRGSVSSDKRDEAHLSHVRVLCGSQVKRKRSCLDHMGR
jgi:hypothetical protein